MIAKPSLPVLDRSHPLTKGLGACYPFFERGGTTLHDISGRNNQGTLINMNPATTWVRTPYGWGLDFNGIDDFVNCGNNSSLDIISNKTISVLAKIPATTNYQRMISRAGPNVSPWYGYQFIIFNDGKLSYTAGYPSHDWKFSNTRWDDNKWHLFVIIISNGTLTFYVDGRSDGSVAIGNGSTGVYDFKIGQWEGNYLKGTIAAACIWNRGLTNNQIIQLYTDPWALYRTFPLYTIGKIPPITTYLRNLALMGVGR